MLSKSVKSCFVGGIRLFQAMRLESALAAWYRLYTCYLITLLRINLDYPKDYGIRSWIWAKWTMQMRQLYA